MLKDRIDIEGIEEELIEFKVFLKLLILLIILSFELLRSFIWEQKLFIWEHFSAAEEEFIWEHF